MNAAQLHALTHPLEDPTPRADLVTRRRINRGAHILVVMLAVDR